MTNQIDYHNESIASGRYCVNCGSFIPLDTIHSCAIQPAETSGNVFYKCYNTQAEKELVSESIVPIPDILRYGDDGELIHVNSTNPMTPEEFYNKMVEIYNDDPNTKDKYNFSICKAHEQADYLMGNLLISLGYEKGIDVFDNALKWYA